MSGFAPPPLSALQPEDSSTKGFTPPPLSAIQPAASHPESSEKPPSFIDRVGRTIKLGAELPGEIIAWSANRPLLPLTRLSPGPATSVAGGIGKGALELAEGLTTPTNIGIMAATGGLGGIAEGLESGVLKSLVPYLGRTISGYFSATMLKGAYDQIPEVKQAIDKKDWPAAAKAITKAMGSGVMGVLAGTHAIRGDVAPVKTGDKSPEAAKQAEAKAEPPEVRAAQPEAQPSKPETSPAQSPAANPRTAELKAEADRLRAENAKLKGTPAPKSTPPEVRAETSPAEAKPAEAKLPAELAGAKPKFNYGLKPFSVKFDSDIDKAAYITAQKSPSKRDAEYVKFVMDQTGLGEAAVRFRGQQIKAALKEQAANAEAGAELHVPSKGEIKKPGDSPAEAIQVNPPEVRGQPPEPQKKVGPVTMGSGLGALQPYLEEAWGEVRDMTQLRQRAMAELEKVKASPADMKYGKAVLENFVGERDWWAARVNQAMERVQKMVPDAKDREAISIMRENTPEEIAQYLDGSHPDLQGLSADDRSAADRNINRMKPVLLRALAPTDAMKAVDGLFTKISADTLKEGKRLGNLDSRWTNEQYVPHILHPEGEGELPTSLPDRLGKALGGKIGKYFSHAATRDYPTFMSAIIQNVKPKTMDIVDAFTTHGDSFATSRATHILVNQLKETGVGITQSDHGKWPKGWVELASHSPEFRATRNFIEDGKAVSIKVPLVVPKYINEALRPVTDPDYISVVPGFRQMRGYQAYMKMAELGISLFHATTENFMALASMGPKGWAKALAADKDTPQFRSGEQDFIADGGTTSIQGRVIEAFKHFQPGSIPSWSDIARRAPIARQMEQAAQATSEFTFNTLARKFKVMDYSMHKAAWIAKHPDATPEQIQAAGKSIAKYQNAVYGGLKTELLGVNKTTTEMARFLMLAPDWLFSNVFNVKYAAEGGPKAYVSQAARAVGLGKVVPEDWEGSAGSDLARRFWVRQAIGGVVATQLLSMAFSGKPSKDPTQVYYGKDRAGNDVYQNVFFKGASGDAINLVHDVHDYGLVEGAARMISNKLAGIPRVALHMASNKDALGKPIVQKGMNPVASTVRAGTEAAKELAPIPIGGSTLYGMMFGPDAWKYSAREVATTVLAGTPPRHIAPEKPNKKPELSIWEQIRTGDVHKVKHRPKPGQPPEVR